MKLYTQTLALFLILIYLSDIRITLRPFSISVDRWMHVLGIMMIIGGCICMKAQSYGDGLKRGAEMKEEVKQDIKSEL